MKDHVSVIAKVLVGMMLAAVVVAALETSSRRSEHRGRGVAEPGVVQGIGDDADARAEEEFLMLRDPRINAIPYDIRSRETAFAKDLVLRAQSRQSLRTAAIQPLVWTERGPNNVGGRTRVFAIDVSAPTTLIAGSVAGGIWRSTDDGASWSLRTSPGQTHSTSCIAQDRRAGKTGTWYVGTGEITGSTTNATRWGALYRGDGIFKSTDGGTTWSLLPSTVSGTPQITDAFDYVLDIATNPANAGQDEVLAAAHTGIRRSTDGGGSWTTVVASDSGWTDVAITSTGVMYAITRSGGLIRVWRSVNGTTWTLIQPGSFPSSANRIVIGLAASNPNAAYFFIQGAPSGINGHQLWKYTYVSGDGSGAGGTWADRTSFLPNDPFDGPINTQGGYDQLVHVKPNDENFVIIGGTNLYRSTNGFTSTAATTVIGGYPFYPALNHHPDLHSGGYSPADPKIYYSGGDGGLARAADVTMAGTMAWTSLNHGYNVTQFYSVAIAPDAGSDVILAGAQDNGSQLGTAPGASNWVQAFGGDGTIVDVSPAVDNRLYTQYQNGQAQRQNWDGTSVTTITPTGSANQLFVNPILLDPNNSLLLYYAAGTSTSTSMIWRNDNAPAASSAGWTSLAVTNVGAGSGYFRRISALGLSTANNSNVMYYGTIDGIVMKAVNVNTNAPTVTNITPPGLFGGTASGGFVRCIAVDPTNSDRALLAFGNYSWPSLWYTTDGGANWTDVEGNLAGSSGPSIRWASMFYIEGQLQVFIGTSIGVLSTTSLAGGATVWNPEAVSDIGNVIVGWMDYRESDHTLAIGTHARGAFTTQFLPVVAVENPPGAAPPARLTSRAYPVPARDQATIAFELPQAAHVLLRLYDVRGREVATLTDEWMPQGRHDVPVRMHGLPGGAYYYELRAGNTIETRKLLVTR